MSTSVTSVLVLDFLGDEKTTKSIRVPNPKEDLTAAQVESAMEKLVDLNAFAVFSTFNSVNLKGAKTVQTVTNKFDIEVN